MSELKVLNPGSRYPLRYYVVGSDDPAAPVVLILHGFPQDLETWAPIAERLSDCRIIMPLQRGYSTDTSTNRWHDYRIAELRSDVIGILSAESSGAVHIVSHDWGGSVAWSIARCQPELVKTLTVISMPEPRALAAAFLGKQFFKSWYVPMLQLPFVPELMTKLWNGACSTWLLHRMGLSRDIAGRYTAAVGALGRMPSGPFNWYRALPFNLPEIASRQEVLVPTLLIWSRQDAAVDPRGIKLSSRWVRSIKLTELPDTSHWIPEERPELVADLVREQIGSVKGI